ncbi:hypothetical protein [Pseudovibrio brasiliensis]|uniref:Uncharacterized protein n=1 Tax=Pseudovibrio brasiliensis TaxID=1898042 RepID=A0ABX8AMR0_9HYPH|nr:hypothetical protein [Pseudovibrio brasiliensis]QUS56359.1 hypothetical protein KGB56_02595 [Pseudovibrio brasiliensis]
MQSVDPYDEDEIIENDRIIRRINPEQHIVTDLNRNCRRISTKAFSPSSEPTYGMSVDIEKLILNAGLVPTEFVTTPTYTGSVSFAAQDIRNTDLIVGYEPIADNPYHGEVWAKENKQRFKNSQKKQLLRAAEWYVRIEDVELG